MEGHRGTASMSRGHQTGQARIATTVGPDDLQRVARREFNRAGSNCAPSSIYVRHLRRTLSSVRQRNYISKWTHMNLLRYRRVCDDSRDEYAWHYNFQSRAWKKLRKNKRSKSSPKSHSMTIVDSCNHHGIERYRMILNIRASGYK